MKPARKGPARPRAKAQAQEQSLPPQRPTKPKQAPSACRRCGSPGPVGDDGFCEKCEKALEQACL